MKSFTESLVNVPSNVVFRYENSFWLKGYLSRSCSSFYCTRLELHSNDIIYRDVQLISAYADVYPVLF